MTAPPNDRSKDRHDRLRQALRENLKRRKSQLRGRADQAAVDNNVDEADPVHNPAESRSRE